MMDHPDRRDRRETVEYRDHRVGREKWDHQELMEPPDRRDHVETLVHEELLVHQDSVELLDSVDLRENRVRFGLFLC